MPTMEYSASVPDQVTNAIQTLTNACSNWPQVPMPDMPVASKLDDTTIAAMHICQTALGNDSIWPSFSFGIFVGVLSVFLGWMLYSFVRGAYEVARHFWPARERT